MPSGFECQPHEYTLETNLHTGVVEDEDEVDTAAFYAAIGEDGGQYDDDDVLVSS
jgi:hypothetical protein